MWRKLWSSPQPVEESLLDRAAEEEGDQILQELPRLYEKMTVFLDYLDANKHMIPKAIAAGFDLSNFKYNPADHPHLPEDLKEHLRCMNKFVAVTDQLDNLCLRREWIRRRLANKGGRKKHAIQRPQAEGIERYATLTLLEYRGREVC